MIFHRVSWIFNEKSWIFTISQGVLGNLGVEGDQPPKMCAGLHLRIRVPRRGDPRIVRRAARARLIARAAGLPDLPHGRGQRPAAPVTKRERFPVSRSVSVESRSLQWSATSRLLLEFDWVLPLSGA